MPDDQVGVGVRGLPVAGRQPAATGVCGPEVAVADDADEQARFLAFLGRQP